MFARLPAPDHVLACKLSGKVDGEDLQRYRSLLESMLEKHDAVSLCVDITGLSDMDADALFEGMKADLELLSHFRQFRRGALVSDKEWPRALIGLVTSLAPAVEMKAFSPEQSDEALVWAAESPPKVKAEKPPVRILPTTRDDVFAFEVDGMIASEEFPDILRQINAFLSRHDRVRMLGRIKHLGGFDPAVFMQSGLVSMKLAAIQKVERYAIVGAPGWLNTMIATLNPLFQDIDMRTFPMEREADAWTWLEAEPIREAD